MKIRIATSDAELERVSGVFVTAEHHRSEGAGARLMAWLKSYARKRGCEQLHLDSGVRRFAAHRFSVREGFSIASHHVSIVDLEGP